MPRNKRQQLKRELAQVLNNLEKSAYGLAYFVELFKKDHADMSEYLEATCKQVLTIRESLLDFWGLIWGKRPSDPDIWR